MKKKKEDPCITMTLDQLERIYEWAQKMMLGEWEESFPVHGNDNQHIVLKQVEGRIDAEMFIKYQGTACMEESFD